MFGRLSTFTAILCAASLVIPSPTAAAGPHQLLLAKTEALVTIKFVLKVKMGGGADNEFEGEITCQLIDPDGLVLCSNTELGGYINLVSRAMGRGPGQNLSAAPTEIRVLIGDQTEGHEASLLARDSDRDLAWVRIEDTGEDGPLPYLDFTRSAVLEVGDKFYSLRRMDKFFGSAPIVTEGTVGAVTRKPRELLVPSPTLDSGFGVPIFTAEGQPVGVTVLQMPGFEDDGGDMFSHPMSLLGESVKLQDMVGGLILPAAEVVKATQLAREVFAAEEEAEEGEGEEDVP
ncbi:MAG: trypsin-like peptidase domain-containing protein [bacterium]|nr:trypsin-like peptidase domain-containing protein [bacterium]